VSQENVEIVRRIFDEFGRGNFRVAQELFDRSVLLIFSNDFPDAGTYRGPEGIATYTRGLLGSWAHFTMEAEHLLDLGNTVLVHVRQRGVGRSSGVPTELRYFQAWTLREHSITRIESFREREQALEAVALRE
jgi:ketosteroid isomerase-like protein